MMEPNSSKKFDFKIDLNNRKLRQALAGFMIIVMLGLGYAGYAINESNSRGFDVYLGNLYDRISKEFFMGRCDRCQSV